MKGEDTKIDLRRLFRPIDVPKDIERPASAVAADLSEAYEKSGIKYQTQLLHHKHGWPNRSREQKGESSKPKQVDQH